MYFPPSTQFLDLPHRMVVPREMEQSDLLTRTDLVVEEVVQDVVNDHVDVQKDVAFYVGRSELTLVDSVR